MTVVPVRRRPRGFVLLLVALSLIAALTAAAYVAVGYRGVRTEQLRHNTHAVQVTATVDRVERHCRTDTGANYSVTTCKYDSYGHYTVANHAETDVQIANAARNAVRGEQVVRVDPADPRHVVRAGDSGTSQIVIGGIGVALLLAIGLFWLVRIRRTQHTG